MVKRYYIALLAFVIVLLVAAFYPVEHGRVISFGVDSYQTHRPIFGSVTQGQHISGDRDVLGVGAIIVNYRKAEKVSPVEISLEDSNNKTVLAKATINPEQLQDDEFVPAFFDSPVSLPESGANVVFSAPQATKDTLLALRFDPESTLTRLENGKEQSGSLALKIYEQVPAWSALQNEVKTEPQIWIRTLFVTLAALLVALIATQVGWNRAAPRTQTIIKISFILLLLVSALISRISAISHMGGVSGGDPYNYLLISQSLMRLENPFEGVKRLPGYPLFLIPALASDSIDDHTYMRVFSVVAGTLAIGMLFLLTRALNLPWAVQVMAPTLLAWQKDFFIVSTRPEPYTLYALLLLTSLYLFFTMTTPKRQLLFGLAIGYAAMTRQEGFVLAATLGFLSLFYWRSITQVSDPNPRLFSKSILLPYVRAFLPALALVLPFFLNNTFIYGNPLYTEYFEGERLQIVDSAPAFTDAAGATWGVLSSMWKNSWENLERIEITHPFFIAGFIFVLAWWLLWETIGRKYLRQTLLILAPIATAVFIFFVYITIYNPNSLISPTAQFTAGMLLASIVPFISYTKTKGIVIVLVLISQVMIATWFHPFAKHYQQSYPLMLLMISTALLSGPFLAERSVTPAFLRKYSFATFTAVLLFPFILVAFSLQSKVSVIIDETNADAALDSVVYRAVLYALKQERPVGFDQVYLQGQVYFGSEGIKNAYPAEETATIAEEEAWLAEKKPKTMLVTNANNIFKTPPTTWKLLKTFKAEGKQERLFESAVYSTQDN